MTGHWIMLALGGAAGLVAALPCSARSQPLGDGADSVLRWVGTGVQVYQCQEIGGSFGWTFLQPIATLSDESGAVRADHGAGPHWTANDGSSVFGTVVTTIPAPPGAGAIPWLVLQASRHDGPGVMSDVAFILRTDTRGGVAPGIGCDLDHEGSRAEIGYRAAYTFVPGPRNEVVAGRAP